MRPASVLGSVAVAAALVLPSLAFAQTLEQVMAGSPKPGEHFGIGVLAGAGWPGPVFGIRGSIPTGPRVGLDLDVGRIAGHGRTVTGQLRWLWRGRNTDGLAPYGIFGVAHFRSTSRTEIRWPDGSRTVAEERHTIVVPQVGLGFDWLSDRGARVGVQFTTGGSENAGPVIYAKLFVLWGPAR